MDCPITQTALLPQHAALIEGSGISPQVATVRGYRSVTVKSELRELGFSPAQCRVPGLLVPVWGVGGKIVFCQLRPDEPRMKNGKPLKYETPAGTRMALDVPPGTNGTLPDPSVPLFVTEGIRKADAAVSKGLCCIALLGVWNWRGSNEFGGKAALPDWESIPLNNRKVYVCFDSDVMEKREVASALSRLKAFLESRKTSVSLIYLPLGPGGSKTGLDDFFTRGGTTGELLQLARGELLFPEEHRAASYEEGEDGLFWNKPTREGEIVRVRLTNFHARVTGDVTRDDGAESLRFFEIESRLGNFTKTFSIPCGKFSGLDWVPEHLGARAIVYPGLGIRDHTRAAIQSLSENIAAKHVYGHTGWRKIGEKWYFLHAGGALGGEGENPHIAVDLPEVLSRYELPSVPSGEELALSIRKSLDLLELLPLRISVPVLAALYRAPLGPANFSVHLAGGSGLGKTAFSLLAQSHFGSFSSLPGSWSSTGNALETLGFLAKDVIFGVDDFAPSGTPQDIAWLHRDADRLLRGQGNQSGRQRLLSDGGLRVHKYPRGIVLSTGEDVPKGESLRARMFVLEISPRDMDWQKLTGCQRDVGFYGKAVAGYIRWLAGRYENLQLTDHTRALRDDLRNESFHKRTPEIVADLAVGARFFLDFAQDAGALSDEGALELWDKFLLAFSESAHMQPELQQGAEPTRRFMDLLSAALLGGEAHVAGMDGLVPALPGAWGWRRRIEGGSFEPLGMRVGWVEGEDLYLDAGAAFAACQRMGRDQGEGICVTLPTLKRRLADKGLLLSFDHRGNRKRFEIRKTIEGVRREVLHLSVSCVRTSDESSESGPICP